jgi:hypothetical protein
MAVPGPWTIGSSQALQLLKLKADNFYSLTYCSTSTIVRVQVRDLLKEVISHFMKSSSDSEEQASSLRFVLGPIASP